MPQKFTRSFQAPSPHGDGAFVTDDIVLWAGDTAPERYVGLLSVCNALDLNGCYHVPRAKSIHPVCRGYHVIEEGDRQYATLQVDYLQVWLCSIRSIQVPVRWQEKLFHYQLSLKAAVDAVFDSYHGAKPDGVMPAVPDAVKIANDNRFVDVPLAALPSKSPRKAISELLRAYARKYQLPHNHVWRTLYRHVNYDLGVDLLRRAENSKKEPLDIAEDIGIIDKVWTLAYRYFND